MLDEPLMEKFNLAAKRRESNAFTLSVIQPKTLSQEKIFKAFDQGKNIFIHGMPGTGKSFCAMYLALEAINEKEYDKVIIVRSAVPSRRQGFLPGNEEEKNEVFELPYEDICSELYNNKGAYKKLENEGKLAFMSTSYLRGLTLDNCIVIPDEVQNMNMGEISTIITRMGNNSRLIVCGDTSQNDLKYLHEDSCINEFHKIINFMPSFTKIEMGIDDVCRGGVVKEWLLAQQKI